MNKQRKEIELKIRKISYEISKQMLENQRSGKFELDISKFSTMLDEWDNLSSYYENANWDYSSRDQIDTEISLFIVDNYLRWKHSLLVRLGGAQKSKNIELVDDLEDALDRLEMYMEKIFKTIVDEDDFMV